MYWVYNYVQLTLGQRSIDGYQNKHYTRVAVESVWCGNTFISVCESVHHCLDTECMQFVSFPVGHHSLHPCLFLFITPSSTLSLSHIHIFLTSVSANLLAITKAVHRHFRRGKSLSQHIQPGGG